MSGLSKMAAVGARDFVQIFGACGFDTFFTDTQNAADISGRLGAYKLVVTTEKIDLPAAPYPIVLNLETGRIYE
jgi:hypothetical protein